MRVKKRVKRRRQERHQERQIGTARGLPRRRGRVGGGAAVLLLATTKSGRELLIRTAQLVLPEVDEQESQESDVQEVRRAGRGRW